MKRLLKVTIGIIISITILFPITSCIEKPAKDLDVQTFLIYAAGNNDLNALLTNNIETLKSRDFIPHQDDKENILLVFRHIKGSIIDPQLIRLYKDKYDTVQEEVLVEYDYSINSASAEFMHSVLAKANELFPAKNNGLLISSHGSGWLPSGFYKSPTSYQGTGGNSSPLSVDYQEYPSLEDDPYKDLVKSVCISNNNEMNITDLASALPIHYDYIIFDCCLMGGIEVAYELKNSVDYLILSPAEVMGDGFPYYCMTNYLMKDDNIPIAKRLEMLSTEFYNLYQSQSGTSQSATVSLIDCNKLEPLAESCREIFANHTEEIASFKATDVQGYFRFNRHWFYDLEDYISRFATDSELFKFQSAIKDAVIYKAATQKFITIDIVKYSGLSTYIYEPNSHYLNEFYKSLKWNMATQLVK